MTDNITHPLPVTDPKAVTYENTRRQDLKEQ